jgi:hypothetical protein
MKKIIVVAIGVVLAGVGYALYYFVSPLFISVRLDEVLPEEILPTTEVLHVDAGKAESQVIPEKMAEDPEVTNIAKTTPPALEPPLAKVVVPASTIGAVVIGTPGHAAGGTARLVSTSAGNVVRYENFSTVNGPDLFVYLASDLEATSFVSLGRLKATEGNINYAVPPEVDIKKYPYALVWCKQFGVLFNSAKIQ